MGVVGTQMEELRPFFVFCVYPGVQAIAHSKPEIGEHR
jgi:hypothetical protein